MDVVPVPDPIRPVGHLPMPDPYPRVLVGRVYPLAWKNPHTSIEHL